VARKRMIAPQFFKHADLYDAEMASGLPLRIAFAGLWTVTDRRGVFQWSRNLKPDVLPYDPCDMLAVLDALAAAGFVQKYEVEGKSYGFIPSFEQHQHFHRDEKVSTLPGPEEAASSTVSTPGQNGASTGPARNSTASNGRLATSDIRHADTTKLPSPRKAAGREGDAKFEALWTLYPKRAGGNPKPLALKAYRARLAAGVTHDELAAGLVRYAAFCAATGKVGTEYVKQAATFFGPSEEAWKELWAIPATLRPPNRTGPTVTEVAAREHEASVQVADRYEAEAYRAGTKWAQEHPDEFQVIKTAIERPYAGQAGAWITMAIKSEMTQRCAKSAGFPSFAQWQAGNPNGATP